MIIVTADSPAEAADLHDLLGQHLAWRHRIYVGGAEYCPEKPAAADPVSPAHELMRQVLREAPRPLTARETWAALAGRGAIASREAAYRWLQADAAVGLVLVTGWFRNGRISSVYAWASEPA